MKDRLEPTENNDLGRPYEPDVIKGMASSSPPPKPIPQQPAPEPVKPKTKE